MPQVPNAAPSSTYHLQQAQNADIPRTRPMPHAPSTANQRTPYSLVCCSQKSDSSHVTSTPRNILSESTIQLTPPQLSTNGLRRDHLAEVPEAYTECQGIERMVNEDFVATHQDNTSTSWMKRILFRNITSSYPFRSNKICAVLNLEHATQREVAASRKLRS
jgi:hypothetical protein